jgi:hypothetical protein
MQNNIGGTALGPNKNPLLRIETIGRKLSRNAGDPTEKKKKKPAIHSSSLMGKTTYKG